MTCRIENFQQIRPSVNTIIVASSDLLIFISLTSSALNDVQGARRTIAGKAARQWKPWYCSHEARRHSWSVVSAGDALAFHSNGTRNGGRHSSIVSSHFDASRLMLLGTALEIANIVRRIVNVQDACRRYRHVWLKRHGYGLSIHY